jgi:alkylation response protein AidB-like acyl-CoA dehydrogenase
MPTYKAPLDDMKFILNDVIDYSRLTTLPGYADFDADTAMSVLEGAAQFCEEVLQPINQSGDAEGCRIAEGQVTTPAGFKAAYHQYVEAGWPALAADEAFGGQGFPQTLRFAVEEMICASNLSFGMFPGLSHGAYHALLMHGADELKAIWLPKLVTGEWAGTMCLTEAHCGTDLGLLTTKAEPQADGSYAITGNKIFISAGDHDLTDNIVHLVLARLPDAPPGIKGISLFIVPKFLLNADGTPGAENGVRCVSIEHKMGIKASPTCVLAFENSIGWLVGDVHKGMRGMFTMMNAARLAVGMQGLGLSEVAYQNAVSYAKDRLQGRSLTGPKNPAGPADPLIVHPDVRRSLMTIRAFNEGARALSLWVGTHIDLHEKSDDAQVRKDADDFVALMTPIVKAYFTDMGFECTNMALQIYGGHGYIREYGMEQFVRDARIAQIYEGANGIQALDLVGRKLPQDGGRLLLPPAERAAGAHGAGSAAHGVRRTVREGLCAAAAGHAVRRPQVAGQSRRSRRRQHRLPPHVRAGGTWRHVAPHGRGGVREDADRERRPGVLRCQAEDGAVLLHEDAPRVPRAVCPDHGGLGASDGAGGRRVLSRGGSSHHGG